MDEKRLATYCPGDDLLPTMPPGEDPPCQRRDAEVMTTAFTAAMGCRGNLESARMLLTQYGSIASMLSKNRLNRTLHHLQESCDILCNL